jgi:cytosine/adenosine deaminase-related metal-dependent hydrolase
MFVRWGGAALSVLLAQAVACGAREPSSVFIDGGVAAPDDDDSGAPDDEADAAIDARDARAPRGAPSIEPGAKDKILLIGTLVTPDETFDGELLVDGDRITCVAHGTKTKCATLAASKGATVIDTQAIIAPGLVDTHNHILFDVFDDSDWLPESVYTNHDDWTAEPRYKAMLDVKQCLANDSQGKPAWCAMTPYGSAAGSLRCEMDKWGELKGLVAGTTSIVGLPGTSAACFGSLARSVDVAQSGLSTDKVQTSALFPPSNPSNVCANFQVGNTNAYLVHCGEGTDDQSLAEFARLGSVTNPADCLYAPQTAITHGTAFTATEFAKMASVGMKLIWSPHSNVSLYGATTDVPAALDAGVVVALGPDWSMGGSANLLEELRFAKKWSADHWNDRLTARDLVEMSTLNGAKVLGLDGTLGALEEGTLADIAVFAGDRTAPYDAIVAATPAEVRLVMVGGVVLYGDEALGAAGPSQPGCETLDVCGASKFICVATASSQSKLDQSLVTIQTTLDQAMSAVDALTPDDGWSFAPLTPLVRCE